MKLEVRTFWFRLTLELFGLGPDAPFRRYRTIPRDASVRRRLLRSVRDRLPNP